MNIFNMKKIFLLGLTLFIIGLILKLEPQKIKPSFLTTQNNNDNEGFITVSPSPEATTVNQKWSLAAVGDIMLSRNVDATIKKTEQQYDYPYTKIKSFLPGDIVFGNLETPLIDGASVPSGTMVFRSDIKNAEALKKAGFTILSLANNHTPNQGQKGLLSTFQVLTDQELTYIGAGKNYNDAYSYKTVQINNFKIAWLAYNDNDVVPPSYGASGENEENSHAGTALMQNAKLEEEIQAAKEKTDFIIISMHSGTEYKELPNSHQIDFAHRAIDAGADLVIGHHPHVVQTIEKYKDKYILYSLGNFIFDQMFSNETRGGILVKFNFLNKKITSIQLVPTMIVNYSQPAIASKTDASWILKRLQYPYTTETDNYYLDLKK